MLSNHDLPTTPKSSNINSFHPRLVRQKVSVDFSNQFGRRFETVTREPFPTNQMVKIDREGWLQPTSFPSRLTFWVTSVWNRKVQSPYVQFKHPSHPVHWFSSSPWDMTSLNDRRNRVMMPFLVIGRNCQSSDALGEKGGEKRHLVMMNLIGKVFHKGRFNAILGSWLD